MMDGWMDEMAGWLDRQKSEEARMDGYINE